MGHLEETILRGDRTDLDRLEKNVVTRVARHGGSILTQKAR
jgi:hypothetical protein